MDRPKSQKPHKPQKPKTTEATKAKSHKSQKPQKPEARSHEKQKIKKRKQKSKIKWPSLCKCADTVIRWHSHEYCWRVILLAGMFSCGCAVMPSGYHAHMVCAVTSACKLSLCDTTLQTCWRAKVLSRQYADMCHIGLLWLLLWCGRRKHRHVVTLRCWHRVMLSCWQAPETGSQVGSLVLCRGVVILAHMWAHVLCKHVAPLCCPHGTGSRVSRQHHLLMADGAQL